MIALPALAMVTACLTGCGESGQETSTYHYPNPSGSAALRIDTENYGGAAGFVRNQISIEADGRSARGIRTLEHMSAVRVFWLNERHVRLCFVGSMDSGEPRWTGALAGQTYQIDLVPLSAGQSCG